MRNDQEDNLIPDTAFVGRTKQVLQERYLAKTKCSKFPIRLIHLEQPGQDTRLPSFN